MKRTIRMVSLIAVVATLGVFGGLRLSHRSIAHAQENGRKAPVQPRIPIAQAPCTFVFDSTNSTSYVAVGPAATVDNGFDSRNVKVQLSSESGVSNAGTFLGITYSVDGGPATIFGPEFFASNLVVESHTHTVIIPLDPGVHTIQPMFRVFPSVVGATGFLDYRCLTAESLTE